MKDRIKIGELARLSGCSPEIIRHYERLGLMEPALRGSNGYRYYSRAGLERLRFIRHSRDFGLSLKTIQDLLAMTERPRDDCSQVDSLVSRHLQDIENRIAALQSMASQLRSLVSQSCNGCVADCRVVKALFGAPDTDMTGASRPGCPRTTRPSGS
ncbi:hypothetical protein CKO35_11555 [Ectothiorhodospira shaposhnikovii]|nr:hypothetical protein [Ectothiorhodospira shaposhnikovii]